MRRKILFFACCTAVVLTGCAKQFSTTDVPAPIITGVVYNGLFGITGQHFDPQLSVVTISGQTFPGFVYGTQGTQQTLTASSITLNDNMDNPSPVLVTVRNVSSNSYPYLFYPVIKSFSPDTARANKPFTLLGQLFGFRSVPSTLRAFYYNSNHQQVYMSPDPAILSWTTNTIQVTIPNYNGYASPVAVVNYLAIYLELGVGGNNTSRALYYSLK